jgi:hypothetical protein
MKTDFHQLEVEVNASNRVSVEFYLEKDRGDYRYHFWLLPDGSPDKTLFKRPLQGETRLSQIRRLDATAARNARIVADAMEVIRAGNLIAVATKARRDWEAEQAQRGTNERRDATRRALAHMVDKLRFGGFPRAGDAIAGAFDGLPEEAFDLITKSVDWQNFTATQASD